MIVSYHMHTISVFSKNYFRDLGAGHGHVVGHKALCMIETMWTMDLLDPHSWRECTELNAFEPSPRYSSLSMTACFSFNGDLYIAIPHSYEIYRISADLSSWKALEVPSKDFALTTYRNQLVLLGGIMVVEIL